MKDVAIRNLGSLWSFRLQSEKAQLWAKANVVQGVGTTRRSILADHRPALELAHAMRESGLTIGLDGEWFITSKKEGNS